MIRGGSTKETAIGLLETVSVDSWCSVVDIENAVVRRESLSQGL